MVLLQRPAHGPGARANGGLPQGEPEAGRGADRADEGQGRREDPPAGVRSGGRRTTPTAREPESAQAAYTEAVKRLARQPQSRAAFRQRLVRLGSTGAPLDRALDRAPV